MKISQDLRLKAGNTGLHSVTLGSTWCHWDFFILGGFYHFSDPEYSIGYWFKEQVMKISQDLRLKADNTGIHRDQPWMPGWLVFPIFLISRLSRFLKVYEVKKSSNPKAFLVKKFRVVPKINPWKFHEDRTTFRGYLKVVLKKNKNNKNKHNAGLS